MPIFKINFKLKSALRTPFHSDTIFGHLCWAYRYLYGEDKLLNWLNTCKVRPTLVSNAFPDGFMPKPVLPPLPADFFRDGSIEDHLLNKKIKKISLIPGKWIFENLSNMSSVGLYTFLRKYLSDPSQDLLPDNRTVLMPHNTFNRGTGKVLEGGLYDTEERFYNNPNFYFFLKSETLDSNVLNALLNYIDADGFGSDKSIGKGNLSSFSLQEVTLPAANVPNAVISLANFIPAGASDLSGYYSTLTKFGKLSGLWATGYNPHKKPVIMLNAGSVILDDDASEQKIYGKLQDNVHTNENIVQYGYAFPLPVHLAEDN